MTVTATDDGDLAPSDDLRARLTLEAAALADADRRTLALIWRDRSRAEAAVGNVFEQLASELGTLDTHPDLVALARRAAADEDRHARVCADLALAYGLAADDLHPPRRVRLVDADPEPRLGTALHLAHACCISETIACAFVGACLAACDGPALAEVHRRHLGDEIRHARLGWAYLATLAPDERAALGPRLPELLARQRGSWLGRIADFPEHGIAGHAYPSRAMLVAAVSDAIENLVLPGFDHLGVPTAAARAWWGRNAENPPLSAG